MNAAAVLFSVFVVLPVVVLCHSDEPTPMTSVSASSEREHIGRHMQEVPDINLLADDELKFLYFKMHDCDGNNLLDGCELVKSLLHWHAEEHKTAPGRRGTPTTRVFGHDELAVMIDPILETDDKDGDGFIDWPEFVAARKSRGF